MKFKKIKRASILGIIGNSFLLVIKGIIGFISGSKAMIADSLNSASDIFSSIMTFIGNKIASVPRDDDHNLGHGKAEYIYSLLISIVMILVSLITIKDSVLSLIYKNTYKFNIIIHHGLIFFKSKLPINSPNVETVIKSMKLHID